MGQRIKRTKMQRQALHPLRQLRVVVVKGRDKGKSYASETDRPISIGFSSDNDLVLSDELVSRYHVEVRRVQHGIELRDLGSRNGTYVAKLRIDRAVVPARTRLNVGKSILNLEDGAAMRASSAVGEGPEVRGLVGSSEAMREVSRFVHLVAPSDASVLIQGETGTGKELVAQAIHQLSSRCQGPFEVVDCGSLPATLIASELFGHERGAFTGADSRFVGAFERANGGTLFLDEVGEMPLEVQPVLLGALERRRFRRVGGQQEVGTNTRVIAASNRDLRAEANAGTFRADLYFRLAVARIDIPPLREHPEDIDELVAHFVQDLGDPTETGLFGDAGLAALRAHRWSGNVRELRNVVESALAMGHLALEATQASSAGRGPLRPSASQSRPYRAARAEAISRFERRYLRNLITRCNGNASEAARQAQMDRPYLLSLLKRHGLR